MAKVTLTFEGLTTDIVQGFLDNAPMHPVTAHEWTKDAASGDRVVSWRGDGEQPGRTYVVKTKVEGGGETSTDCRTADSGALSGNIPITV